MARLKAFEAAHPTRFGPVCKGCQLPPKIKAFLIEDKKRGSTAKALAAVVTGAGHVISSASVQRHLREHSK